MNRFGNDAVLGWKGPFFISPRVLTFSNRVLFMEIFFFYVILRGLCFINEWNAIIIL
jgi:hypothetical protein